MKPSKKLLVLLRQPGTGYIATVMADGASQMTRTWVDTDSEHVHIDSVQGYVTLKNVSMG